MSLAGNLVLSRASQRFPVVSAMAHICIEESRDPAMPGQTSSSERIRGLHLREIEWPGNADTFLKVIDCCLDVNGRNRFARAIQIHDDPSQIVDDLTNGRGAGRLNSGAHTRYRIGIFCFSPHEPEVIIRNARE